MSTAIISGATHGIGKASVEALAEWHGNIIGIADNPADTRGQELEARFPNYHHINIDVTDDDAMKRFAEHDFPALSKVPPDLILICSGIGAAPVPIDNMDAAQARRILDVNLMGPAIVMKYLLPLMKEGGCLAVCGSIAADTPGTGADWSYASSKAGLIPLLKETARDSRYARISFLHLKLGHVRTRMTAQDDSSGWLLGTPYAQACEPQEAARKILLGIERAETGFSEIVINGGGAPDEFPAPRLRGRRAGVLCAVSSLANPYGCGTIGPESYQFVEQIREGGFTYWLHLPIHPTGVCNSPYCPQSSIAGNINLISPDLLREDGLLREEDCARLCTPSVQANYGHCYTTRYSMLRSAWRTFSSFPPKHPLRGEYERFCRDNAEWLTDCATYLAIKWTYQGKAWQEWDDSGLKAHQTGALEAFSRSHAREISLQKFAQFLFFRQFRALRDYAHQHGVELVGDVPFYVNLDSWDSWAHRELFLIDSQTGWAEKYTGTPHKKIRHWGTIAYRWEAHRKDGYAWWRARVRFLASLYDGLRIDHAVALRQSYLVSADGSGTAWVDGPDVNNGELSQAITHEAARYGTAIIAEDLGKIAKIDDLRSQMERLDWYGIRVLQYAYQGSQYGAQNDHMPFRFTHRRMAFTATHDNPPTAAYLSALLEEDRDYMMYMLNVRNPEDLREAFFKAGYNSVADLLTIPVQDILGLGEEGTMVYHKNCERSWLWRMDSAQFRAYLPRFRAMAVLSGRLSADGAAFRKALEEVKP